MRTILVIGFLMMGFALNAQPVQFSEQDLSVERMFIEAKTKALIGDMDGAVELYKNILTNESNNDVAAYELAKIYLQIENYGEAVKSINLALGNHSGNKWYHLLKVDILEKSESFDQAALAYDPLLRMEPFNAQYLYAKAFQLVKAENSKDAILVLDRVEELLGVMEHVTLLKHDLYRKDDKSKQAIVELEKLIDAYPDKMDYRHLLANYYNTLGKESKADEIYQQILTFDKDDARAKIALAKKYKEKGDDANYLESIMPIIENPAAGIDEKIQELIPYIQQLEGDPGLFPNLKQLGEALVKAHPDDAKAHSILGDIYSIGGDDDEAIKCYQQTLELDKSVYAVWEQLLRLLAEKKDFEQLLEYSEESVSYFPNQRYLHYMNGIAYLENQQFGDAIYALEEAVLMSENDPALKLNAMNLLGNVYLEQGEYSTSIDMYEQVLAVDANFYPAVHGYVKVLCASNEKLDRAQDMVNRLLAKNPNQPNYLATQALVYYKQNQLEQARDVLKSAINQDDPKPDHLELMGDVLFKLGQVDQAIKHWQSALDSGSNSKLLKRKIDEKSLLEQ